MSTSEKKTINYNGMELECIESGYWPDGVTLVHCDDGDDIREMTDVVCLRFVRAIAKDGRTSGHWRHWAILPPKPAPRRLTNRQIHKLWRNGWDIKNKSGLICTPEYTEDVEDATHIGTIKLRAPNTDEWLEPTSDLLEVAK